MSDLRVRFKGYLDVLNTLGDGTTLLRWDKKYCVLRTSSEPFVLLDFFETANDFLKHRKAAISFNCKDVQELTRCHTGMKHVLTLNTVRGDSPFTFICKSEAEAMAWLRAFNDAVECLPAPTEDDGAEYADMSGSYSEKRSELQTVHQTASVPVYANQEQHASASVYVSRQQHASAPVYASQQQHASAPVYANQQQHASAPVYASQQQHASAPVYASQQQHASAPVYANQQQHASAPVYANQQQHASAPVYASKQQHASASACVDEPTSHYHSLCDRLGYDEDYPYTCLKDPHSSQDGRRSSKSTGTCDTSQNETAAPDSNWSVDIVKSKVSKRCKLSGRYSLDVTETGLRLRKPDALKSVYYWPYINIRRFASTTSLFEIEAGRNSDSGPGTLSFRSESGKEIHAAVRAAITRITVVEGTSSGT